MPIITVQVSEQKLLQMPTLEAAIGRAVKRTALRVVAGAQDRCPVKTGNLRASIHASDDTPLREEVAASASYAMYVEMGTVRMAAQPFLQPALLSEQDRFTQDVRDAIGGVQA